MILLDDYSDIAWVMAFSCSYKKDWEVVVRISGLDTCE
jgi:hypothetical protein